MIKLPALLRLMFIAFAFCAQGRLLAQPQTQLIQAFHDYDMFSVDVVSGGNTLAELFPDAPDGLILLKFDNARGYSVYQKYPAQWSRPEATLTPGEGVIAVLPKAADGSIIPFSRAITGEAISKLASPFSGPNLLSVKSISAPGFHPKENDTVYWFSDNSYKVSMFNETLGGWSPPILQPEGKAVWYSAAGWPAHPDAGAQPVRSPIYFNNYAPAVGVNAPFVDNLGNPLSGQAQLILVSAGGVRTPLGPPVSLGTGAFAGYIDPGADLLRYVAEPSERVTLVIEIKGERPLGETPAISVFSMFYLGFGPPGAPAWLRGLQFEHLAPPPEPEFLVQPQPAHVALGASAEFAAVFNYRDALKPAESISAVFCGEAGQTCPVVYQWEKKNSEGAWVPMPGANAPAFQINSVTPQDYGVYRLRASWGGKEVFSADTRLEPPLRLALDGYSAAKDSVSVSLTTTQPARRAQWETSSDLKIWTPMGDVAVEGVDGIIRHLIIFQFPEGLPEQTFARFFRIRVDP